MVVPYLSEFGALRANLRLYRETFAARHPDRPLPPVQMSFHLHVAETDAQAVAEASEPMQQYISVFRESAAAWEGRSSVAYPGYQQLITELDSMNIERVLREGRGFIGSPSSVERQVREAVDLFGDIEPSLSVLWGHMPYHQAEHSLRLFAAEVMPRLSEATAIAAPRIGT
jgi:alkanesulfonate monooxygenase SsuD/methylene tetrahydromethanopterin reductase-like flavin-dependent oxidoreductase (luciferase family)